jgi:small subunit ribosomal protein S9
MAKKLNYTYASGKRRSSSARVRLFHGKGENTVNGISLEKYFPGIINKSKWSKPFGLTETSEKYYFSAKVLGGGKEGQIDAVVQGLAKALAKVKPDKFRAPLKKAGLLTRDSRIRERRKVGMGGKARRKRQSPKR